MAMFMPSQSHSGGVIVKPYIGNIVQELQFLSGEDRKKIKSLHWVAFLNIGRTLDFRIHLSNLIKKGLHGSAFSFSIYQVKKYRHPRPAYSLYMDKGIFNIKKRKIDPVERKK